METLNPTQTTYQKQLIDVQEVKAITGHSVTTIYKYVKQGIFPQPKKMWPFHSLEIGGHYGICKQLRHIHEVTSYETTYLPN